MGWTRRKVLAALGAAGAGAYWYDCDHCRCVRRREARWTVWSGFDEWSPPVVSDGTVFAGEGFGITDTNPPDDTYRIGAYDAYDGAALWVHNEVSAGVGVPRPTADAVYVPTGRNRIYAFDWATGRVRWR